ncbi:MAG: hypothetical protein ABI439_14600 [Rhodospirillales bacterium]
MDATILVAHGDPLQRMLDRDMFMAAGYRVFEAQNAEQAIAVLQVHDEIAVLFMHMNIKEAPNGPCLAYHVTKHWPKVTIIAVSGQPRSDKIPDSAHFHAKPYDPAVVLRQVKHAAANRTAGTTPTFAA